MFSITFTICTTSYTINLLFTLQRLNKFQNYLVKQFISRSPSKLHFKTCLLLSLFLSLCDCLLEWVACLTRKQSVESLNPIKDSHCFFELSTGWSQKWMRTWFDNQTKTRDVCKTLCSLNTFCHRICDVLYN